MIGDVARFFGDGLRWVLDLPLDEFARWHGVMTELRARDHVR
jgi:hypothetical protein